MNIAKPATNDIMEGIGVGFLEILGYVMEQNVLLFAF